MVGMAVKSKKKKATARKSTKNKAVKKKTVKKKSTAKKTVKKKAIKKKAVKKKPVAKKAVKKKPVKKAVKKKAVKKMPVKKTVKKKTLELPKKLAVKAKNNIIVFGMSIDTKKVQVAAIEAFNRKKLNIHDVKLSEYNVNDPKFNNLMVKIAVLDRIHEEIVRQYPNAKVSRPNTVTLIVD